MGKWNRRFARRSFYQDKPPPPHCLYYTGSCYRGEWKNRRLHWEERFCLSVGIPFQKVVVAKNYMHCHEIVVNWNDSASEEAFHNAKRRFWASINSLPFDDNPLLDPDMYNAEIDWNPEIDPELIADLERAYFNPDEAQKSDVTDEMGPTCKADNPWESNCNNPRILENVNNPWVEPEPCLKNGLWGGDVNKLWGDAGWGCRISSLERTTPDSNSWGNNAGGLTRWGSNGNGSWNTDKGENCWKSEGQNSRGWKNWESQNNERRNFDYGGVNRGVKREGPPENNAWRYKSSRFKGEDLGVSQQWGHQRNQKKVSFV